MTGTRYPMASSIRVKERRRCQVAAGVDQDDVAERAVDERAASMRQHRDVVRQQSERRQHLGSRLTRRRSTGSVPRRLPQRPTPPGVGRAISDPSVGRAARRSARPAFLPELNSGQPTRSGDLLREYRCAPSLTRRTGVPLATVEEIRFSTADEVRLAARYHPADGRCGR